MSKSTKNSRQGSRKDPTSWPRKGVGRLKTQAWPEWYSENLGLKINALRDEMRENALEALKGPWKGLKCDNCGAKREEFVLTDAGVGNLLRKGKIELESSKESIEAPIPKEILLRITCDFALVLSSVYLLL